MDTFTDQCRHILSCNSLDPTRFQGSHDPTYSPGQLKWQQIVNYCCSSLTEVNHPSIGSSDVPDEEDISQFVPPRTEQGFKGAVKAAASFTGITFKDNASPDKLLFAIICNR